MKRSEINSAIKEAIKFFKKNNFSLPDYAYFSPDKWLKNSKNYEEVINCRLGWDVTDVGLGNFKKFGRTIFTLRNGNLYNKKYPKSYAQKIMCLTEDQRMPVHFHKKKMEDIINFAGGTLQVKVWPKNKNMKLTKDKFSVIVAGKSYFVKGGTTFSLKPGESICIVQGTFHQFWAKKGTGKVLSMEISTTNDDLKDNIWLTKATRFPKIEEDVKKEFVLCSEYSTLM